jgi:hypothetical protein
MIKPDRFVNPTTDLCTTCIRGFKGGCPIYPPLEITRHCVEYSKRGTSPTSKK